MAFKIGANQKLVMIGDSITDAGRTQPVAEGLFDPLGKGYVTMVEALIGSTYHQLGIRVVNVGTSGNTSFDLKNRWQKDVIDLKPDWLTIMIGTNDVWRQFDLPRIKEWHVSPEAYEANLRSIVEQVRPSLKGLVMMSPFYIEPNRKDAMRARMDQYGAIVKKVAGEYKAIFVDVQAAFDEVLSSCYPAALSWDRVHPNQTGHMVIAKAFLNGLGYKW